jgi:hypothetical protein
MDPRIKFRDGLRLLALGANLESWRRIRARVVTANILCRLTFDVALRYASFLMDGRELPTAAMAVAVWDFVKGKFGLERMRGMI